MNETPSLRLRAEIAHARHGAGPFVAAVLLLGGTLGWGALLLAPAEPTIELAEAVTPPARRETAEATLAAWRERLTAPDAIGGVIRTVLAQADEAGVEVGRVEYRWPEGEGGGAGGEAGRLRIGLPLRGSHAQIKRFSGGLLAGVPAVSIDQIALKRASSDGGAPEGGHDRLDAMLWLSVWQTGLLR